MAKVMQIGDVPDDVHAILTRAARDRGLSLTKYLVAELEHLARRSQIVAGALVPGLLGEEELGAPYLIDSEVTRALRGPVARGVLTRDQGAHSLAGFIELTLIRFSAESLRPRMWQLRDSLSA